jgi:predicted nucleic acid-binding protein
MIFLDAFGIVAFARSEPAAADIEEIIAKRDPVGLLSINRAEVVDVLIRDGETSNSVAELMLLLDVGGVQQVALDPRTADLAGRLRSMHYRRRSCEVSLADCCVLAAAQRSRAAIASADPALARVARTEGIALVPLPDSAGRRP